MTVTVRLDRRGPRKRPTPAPGRLVRAGPQRTVTQSRDSHVTGARAGAGPNPGPRAGPRSPGWTPAGLLAPAESEVTALAAAAARLAV